MSDYIKREDAVKALRTIKNCVKLFEDGIEDVAVTLNDLAQSADVVERTRWIPVTERMPAMYHPVLTFDGEFHAIEMRVPYILDDDGNQIKSDWWVEADNDINAEYYRGLRDGAATHWMPLPEPPKEGE